MTIVVAYKWAANPQDAQVGADGAVDLSRAKPGVSEYDPVAIETGRRLADATGAELVGLSVGGPQVGTSMARKAALSRGLDRLVVVADEALDGARAATTAAVLAAQVREIGDVDLVLTGDGSVDEGAHLVPAVLAGHLGWPLLVDVTAVERAADGGLRVTRSVGAGTQVLEVDGPAVLSVAADAVVPRVPGMKDILGAGKKPVAEATVGQVAVSEPAVVGRKRPALAQRKGRLLTGADTAAVAAELVAALRADGVL
ncbi:MAG: electron transfer flavoprotein beta subunit/FixA family protein [Actinobacteria bacterium]|nr:electron transfer flavoprotein beta subunit/FixA family protein [Actinomycetota bacterium]